MKKYIPTLLVVILSILSFWLGCLHTEEIYLRRALDLPDDIECFTNQDIEHILLGTPMQTKRD